MKKIYHTWHDVECQTQEILRQIVTRDSWRPDYVVGITRGGLVPANLISQYLDCPMHTLRFSLRDGAEQESNLWMAEDAFGHRDFDPMCGNDGRKNILIVDDINDSGATLNWIKKDWPSGCFPKDARWKQIWGSNVRVACLYDNESSASKLDVMYSAISINKSADPAWIVFPWESWCQK
jgi:hypoxanthine phosphoribosyltransferase